jgi:glycosyltransferase involved in cell wall biosynthesis
MEVDHALTIDRPRAPEHLSVLHVAQPVVGGVARGVADLAADQAGRGWRVAVACPDGGELAAAVRAAGAEHAGWEAGREPGPRALGETRRLWAIVRDRRPELVHLHSSKAGLAGRLTLRGSLPTVFQPHGWSFDAVGGVNGWAAARWERFATRWADVLVCVSESDRLRGEQRGLSAPWRVVPNAVPLEAFPPASATERSAARARLGLGAGPLVVCVGRLAEAKGQDVLLEAWPAVAAAVPEARLVLVGDGPDGTVLERSAPSGVTFAGHSADVAGWLAAADVVAVPSRREGMSVTMLEAMASARSVVATDVPGAREALGDEAGAVVPVGDTRAIADALAERLRDPALAEAEGRAGRRRADEGHDLNVATEAIAQIYGEVLSARGASYVAA